MVERLLRVRGIDREQGPDGYTPLQAATAESHTKVIQAFAPAKKREYSESLIEISFLFATIFTGAIAMLVANNLLLQFTIPALISGGVLTVTLGGGYLLNRTIRCYRAVRNGQ